MVSTFVLYWTGFLYHIFLASEISMLGTSMPLLMQFAATHGLNALKLGMIWVFASGGKIFVYQSGVLIVGYAYGYFRPRDILRPRPADEPDRFAAAGSDRTAVLALDTLMLKPSPADGEA